jgi:hypothetical protein
MEKNCVVVTTFECTTKIFRFHSRHFLVRGLVSCDIEQSLSGCGRFGVNICLDARLKQITEKTGELN